MTESKRAVEASAASGDAQPGARGVAKGAPAATIPSSARDAHGDPEGDGDGATE